MWLIFEGCTDAKKAVNLVVSLGEPTHVARHKDRIGVRLQSGMDTAAWVLSRHGCYVQKILQARFVFASDAQLDARARRIRIQTIYA